MKSIKVDVKPEFIYWLKDRIKQRHMDPKLLEELDLWLTDPDKPRFTDVQYMSSKTKVSFGYFFSKRPPRESKVVKEFRTLGSESIENMSLELIEILNHMEDIKNWMSEYLEKSNIEPLSYGGMVNLDQGLQEAVQTIRVKLGISEDWIVNFRNSVEAFKYIRSKIEDLNIIVMVSGTLFDSNKHSLNLDEFRAFCLYDDYAPLIFINSKDRREAMIFSALHELAHIFVGENNLFFGPNSDIEALCNNIAEELMIPDQLFLKQWNYEREYFDLLKDLASYFNSSLTVAAIKAKRLGLINQDEYKVVVSYVEKAVKNKKTGGGTYYNTKQFNFNHRFLKLLNHSMNEGSTKYTDGLKLTRTNLKSFPKLIERIS